MIRRLLFVATIAASFAFFSAQSRPAAMLSAGRCWIGTSVIPVAVAKLAAMVAHKPGDQVTITFSGALTIVMSDHHVGVPAGGSPFSYTYTTSATDSVGLENRTGASITSHWSVSLNGGCDSTAGVTGWNFTDGRLNSHDGAQTAAIYCESDGGVTVYAVIDSVGHFAFTATKAEINAIPLKPIHNTLIKSGLNVALYRLTSGELQINAPDNYVFAWDGCI